MEERKTIGLVLVGAMFPDEVDEFRGRHLQSILEEEFPNCEVRGNAFETAWLRDHSLYQAVVAFPAREENELALHYSMDCLFGGNLLWTPTVCLPHCRLCESHFSKDYHVWFTADIQAAVDWLEDLMGQRAIAAGA